MNFALPVLLIELAFVPASIALAGTPRPACMDFSKISSTSCDIVILDSSLGAVSSALMAARSLEESHSPATICMTSMTDWVGGQLTTQGVSILDEPGPHSGYDSNRIKEEALSCFKPVFDTIPNEKHIAWVGRYSMTPLDANLGLKQALSHYVKSGKLKLFCESVPIRANRDGDRIESLDMIARKYTGKGAKPYEPTLSEEIGDWYDAQPSIRYQKKLFRTQGKIFIDGSDTGELLALSGADYHQGGSITGKAEENDPECLSGSVMTAAITRATAREQLPKWVMERVRTSSSVDGNAAYSIHLDQDGQNLYSFWPQPGKLSIFDYRRLPSLRSGAPLSMLNWESGNDFTARSLLLSPSEVERQKAADWKGGVRPDVIHQMEDHTLSFILYLNAQPEVEKEGKVALVTSPDPETNPFGTGSGLARFPYIRESRRMVGYNGFQISREDIQGWKGKTNWKDSVGIGSFPMDARSCPGHKIPPHFPSKTKLYQIPLRALISRNVSNLLAGTKNLSMDKGAASSIRTHETDWNIGAGAGAAAAIAVLAGKNGHQLIQDPSLVHLAQATLLAAACPVQWFSRSFPSLSPLPHSPVPTRATNDVTQPCPPTPRPAESSIGHPSESLVNLLKQSLQIICTKFPNDLFCPERKAQ